MIDNIDIWYDIFVKIINTCHSESEAIKILTILQTTCKIFYGVIENDYIWGYICKKFHIPITPGQLKKQFVKSIYINKEINIYRIAGSQHKVHNGKITIKLCETLQTVVRKIRSAFYPNDIIRCVAFGFKDEQKDGPSYDLFNCETIKPIGIYIYGYENKNCLQSICYQMPLYTLGFRDEYSSIYVLSIYLNGNYGC